jgi:hypothetical protein
VESLYGDFTTVINAHPLPDLAAIAADIYGPTPDAFGVVNFLTLHREHTRASYLEQKDDKYLTMARLVETVHDVLIRLPGATDENPLGGGLRIGKMVQTMTVSTITTQRSGCLL